MNVLVGKRSDYCGFSFVVSHLIFISSITFPLFLAPPLLRTLAIAPPLVMYAGVFAPPGHGAAAPLAAAVALFTGISAGRSQEGVAREEGGAYEEGG